MKILLTGAAGFIGSRVAEMLAQQDMEVLGVDNLNSYYDPALKLARLRRGGFEWEQGSRESKVAVKDANLPEMPPEGKVITSEILENLKFVRLDVRDSRLFLLMKEFIPDIIIHLAAQPGVRSSIKTPEECLECNIMAFMRILELGRQVGVRRILYASSSSVYGDQQPHAFRESDSVDNPASVYAISKRTNEMLASVYAGMYGIRMVGLRFFSVYGEWGRPDMAPYIFTEALIKGSTITLFNGGRLSRDFTYIEDVAKCVCLIIKQNIGYFTSGEDHEVINIGHGHPTLMTDFVRLLEKKVGRKGKLRFMPMQPGDVHATMADTSKLKMQYGYKPSTSLEEGIGRFVNWYREYSSLGKVISDDNIEEENVCAQDLDYLLA